MKLLSEISESDIGLSSDSSLDQKFSLRKAARAIIFNKERYVALLRVKKHKYHKLPGGGMEDSEDIKTALEREIMEEVGAQIKITNEVGVIIEYKNAFKELQISYCYTAELIGIPDKPMFTPDEISAGFELIWVKIEEAIGLVEKDLPETMLENL